MEPPKTADRFRALVQGGRLLDLGGRPLRFATCEWCGGETVGSTCPVSVTCPDCKAKPGQWCVRPSGHRSQDLHALRRGAAEVTDSQREAAGDSSVPRRWEDQP